MPVTVRKVVLWRKEVENKTGILAQTLEPFAKVGADLHVVMAYRYPGNETMAAVEVYSVTGKKLTAAAAGVGLAASSIPTLLFEATISRVWGMRLRKQSRVRESTWLSWSPK